MKLKRLSQSLVACFACYNLNVGAQDALSGDLFSLPIEQLMQLEVASATLSNESLLDVPSSVAVFNRDEIKKLGLDYVHELTNFVTGIQSTRSDRDPKFNKISARGKASSSEGGDILILLNGQRINSEYSGANNYTFPLIPLAIAEKIEIIKGPGSAIYGSNAFLGVINIITVSDEKPQVTIETGNFGSIKATASAGFVHDDFSIQAIVNHSQDDGDLYQAQVDSFNPQLVHDTRDPIEHQEVVLNIKKAKTSLQVIMSEQDAQDYYVQGILNNDFNRAQISSKFITFNQQLDWNDTLSTDVWLDYRDNQSDLDLLGLPMGIFFQISEPQSAAPLLAKTPIYERAKGLRINNFYQYSDDIRLSIGFEHRRSNLQKDESSANFNYAKCLQSQACRAYLGQQAFDPAELPNIEYYNGAFEGKVKFTDVTKRDINGAFVQAQIQASDRTQLTLAARYDKYSDIGSNISPRFSVVHNLNDNVTFKANYGEAYRAPQFNELGLINNPLILGNINLKPETIKSLDFISLMQFSDWTASLTYFQHSIKDAIVAEPVATTVMLNNQDSNTITRGIEAEITYIPTSNFYLKSGFTHLIDKGRDQFRESNNLLFLIANYRLDKLNINVSANYQDDKQTAEYLKSEGNLTELDSYLVANGKISYQFSDQINFYFKAKNLFDKEYASPAISNRVYAGLPNRSRQWSIGAEFSF
ncbi:TonB-dependent receptor plug domain-containing protein [Catenovulum sp. SX2]|uniref:TonB-dependent receptor plug domain-containing protein n=1 Tax=Catenovulum sp. SX2 TaxID=3398614 RepID=UPI003F84E159